MTRPRAKTRAALAVTLAAASLAACGDDGSAPGEGGAGGAPATTTITSVGTSTTSSTSTGGGGGEPVSCGPVPGNPPSEACAACTTPRCCAELEACAAVPRCEAPTSCLQACGDDFACIDACALEHWGDTPQSIDVIACQREHCAEACGLAPRDCSYLIAPPNAADRDACHECLGTDCCDAFSDQMAPEFLAFAQCAIACLDMQCLRACELAHPDALPIADALSTCVIGTCGDSCAAGLDTDICGGLGIDDVTCAECNRERCCDAHEACGFDLSCTNVYACVAGCADPASCRACYEAWDPATAGEALAMDACTSVACPDACPGFPSCGAPRRLLAPTCEACLVEGCCDELGACTTDAGCAALLVCTTLCDGDAACEAACAEAHPDGDAGHTDLVACRAAACSELCP